VKISKNVIYIILMLYPVSLYSDSFDTLYSSRVDNLILRQAPSINSNNLRVLKKNEIIILLEKENPETINGITAQWFKVKTQWNNDIGYIFSGYIEKLDHTIEIIDDRDNIKKAFCNNIDNSYKCAQEIEFEQVKTYNNFVKREGRALELSLNNGLKTTFNNQQELENSFKLYTFYDYIRSINYYVVLEHFQESGKTIFINRTNGNAIEVWDNTYRLSPNNRYIVITSPGWASGLIPNGIQIVDIDKGKIVFQNENKFYEPHNPVWISNDKIEINKYYRVNLNNKEAIFKGQLHIVRKNNAWVEE